jgi:tetratricopeptide (TPR) repeat protein
MPGDAPPSRRFEIALSFPGEHRPVVEAVAALLAEKFTENRVLYDEYHDAEFARPDLDLYLPPLYLDASEIIVIFLCPEYPAKRWCNLEWRHIRQLINTADARRILFLSFGKLGRIPELGILESDGKLDITGKSPELVVEKILKRLALNRGNSPRPIILNDMLSNLPGGYLGRAFRGREEFLEAIHQSLQDENRQTAATHAATATGICGLGGIGKTHAAVKYACDYRGNYTALLFASGDSPEKLHASLAGLCIVVLPAEIDLLPPDQAAREATALRWLSANPGWLLIIDNVDDESSARAVRDLLGQLAGGHLLITTRLHRLPSQIHSIHLDVLSEDSATGLLLELTEDDRRPAADDEEQARQLAQILDGLPLAIQQAAGYINEHALNFVVYIDRYNEEAADLLNWHNELESAYPRPVLLTWKASFDQLSEDDRFWLLVFSHFAPDPIPEFLLQPSENATAAQKSLLRAASDAISHAEKYSLLTRSRTAPAFKLHRLVQQITRHYASKHECQSALARAIQLIAFADPGDPQNVRTWGKWHLLQPHAVAICGHAPDAAQMVDCTGLLNQLGLLANTKTLHAEAEKYLRRALRIHRATYGDNHPSVAIDLNNVAQLLLVTNRISEAEPMMRDALRIDRAAYGEDHPEIAIRLNNLAQLLQATNRLSEAEPLMRDALRINLATYGNDHREISISLNNLAHLLQETNRMSQAEPLMRAALRIDRATHGDDHPEVSISLANLAALLVNTNRFSEAEPLIRDALRIDLDAYGTNHPRVATVLNNLAQLLKATDRITEAEPLMHDALRIDRAAYGDDHPLVAIRLSNLAQLLQATSRLSDAEPLMHDALRIDRAAYGNKHPLVALRLNNLAQLLQATNRLSEAEPLMREALRITRAAYGNDHPDVAIHLNNLALLLKATNRLVEAEPLIRDALQIDRAAYGDHHPHVAIRFNNLASLLHKTDRLSDAVPLMRDALRIFHDSLGPEHSSTVTVSRNLEALLEEMKNQPPGAAG